VGYYDIDRNRDHFGYLSGYLAPCFEPLAGRDNV
jgi:hypothetical protein